MAGEEQVWRDAPPPVVAPPVYPTAPARDWAYTIGEPLLKLVRAVARIPFGLLLLIAGWGISVPAWVLTRPTWPQVLRFVVAAAALVAWVAVIASEAAG